MTPEYFRTLFDYNTWANRHMLDACAALSAEQFVRPLGSSFASVRDTLTHIFWAEWLWFERWHGRSHGLEPPWRPFEDLASLRVESEKVDRDLVDFVAGLAGADLERVHDYKDTKGHAHRSPMWQMLQHLANHGTYHRGQVTTLLRQLGAKPVSTDLIAFYREHAAAAAR